MYKKLNRVNLSSLAVFGGHFTARSREVKNNFHEIVCHVNVGLVIEYNACIIYRNASRDTTIRKSKE